MPARKIDVKGTIGAGAMFSAAYLHAAIRAWPLEQALPFAVAAATLKCESLSPDAPALQQVLNDLNALKKPTPAA